VADLDVDVVTVTAIMSADALAAYLCVHKNTCIHIAIIDGELDVMCL